MGLSYVGFSVVGLREEALGSSGGSGSGSGSGGGDGVRKVRLGSVCLRQVRVRFVYVS